MSNKITFSAPSEAKLTWKATFNGQDVTNELENLSVTINNEKIELDENETEYKFHIDKTSVIHMSTEWNGSNATSMKVIAEYVKPDVASYYGSLVIEPNNNDHGLSDSNLSAAIKNYFDDLDVESMVDNKPLTINGKTVANPNSLIKHTVSAPNNMRYDFVCADFVSDTEIDQSRPVVIYPTSYGVTQQIIDDLQTNCINDFIRVEFEFEGESYYAYVLKSTNSLATDDGVTLPFTFKK